MGRAFRWYRKSVFPDALRRVEVLLCGLFAFVATIAVEFVKVRYAHLPQWVVETPWNVLGPILLIATLLISLIISDAKRTRRLLALESPRLEVVFEPGTCDDCNQMVGGVRKVSIGLWNPSAMDVDDVHVFVESLEPTPIEGGLPPGVHGFTGKREIWGLGQPGVRLGTIRGSSMAGHSHVSLLSRFSAALEVDPDTGVMRVLLDVPQAPVPVENTGNKSHSGYVLEVGGGFSLVLQEYTATLAVEAANMRPRVVKVRINTQASPAITEVRA